MKTEQKEELLGSVSVDPSVEISKVDLEILKSHENPDTVISAFCENCGSYHELNFASAEKILMTLNQPLEFDNKYFLFHSCSLCKGEDLNVELKSF